MGETRQRRYVMRFRQAAAVPTPRSSVLVPVPLADIVQQVRVDYGLTLQHAFFEEEPCPPLIAPVPRNPESPRQIHRYSVHTF